MDKLLNLKPEKVFYYFEKIAAIPHGSSDMDAISGFCVDFAKKNGLDFIRDEADNVIIFKSGTAGYENSEPVILQGHLDMVCQRDEGVDFDFEKDGIDIFVDGDFIKAKGTTLGADNGIAVAVILAILESRDIPHPPIEAVFTTDEEIGMLGAAKLDFDKLKSKRMINIDSEDLKILTVACAGGSDLEMTLPVEREGKHGKKVRLTVTGLKGGHSGVEINAGRVNADILAGRILNFIAENASASLISIDGGSKGNAIPRNCCMELCVENPDEFQKKVSVVIDEIKKEISSREADFTAETEILEDGTFSCLNPQSFKTLIFTLVNAPNGVMEMSADIEGLVETSLNLGILKTDDDSITLLFALRSSIASAMKFLENRLLNLGEFIGASCKTSGHYPPWEFKENSPLQRLYKDVYSKITGSKCTVEAIHAGLECAVFANGIDGLDCISIGPEMHDIHTTSERLSISSVGILYEILLELLKNLK